MPELIADLPAVAILLPAASVYFLWALFHWIFRNDDDLSESGNDPENSTDHQYTSTNTPAIIGQATSAPLLQSGFAPLPATGTDATTTATGQLPPLAAKRDASIAQRAGHPAEQFATQAAGSDYSSDNQGQSESESESEKDMPAAAHSTDATGSYTKPRAETSIQPTHGQETEENSASGSTEAPAIFSKNTDQPAATGNADKANATPVSFPALFPRFSAGSDERSLNTSNDPKQPMRDEGTLNAANSIPEDNQKSAIDLPQITADERTDADSRQQQSEPLPTPLDANERITEAGSNSRVNKTEEKIVSPIKQVTAPLQPAQSFQQQSATVHPSDETDRTDTVKTSSDTARQSSDNKASTDNDTTSPTHIRPGQKKTATTQFDNPGPTPPKEPTKYRTAARRKPLSPADEVTLQLKTDATEWNTVLPSDAQNGMAKAHEKEISAKDDEISRLKKQLQAFANGQVNSGSRQQTEETKATDRTILENALAELEGSARKISRLQSAVNTLQASKTSANVVNQVSSAGSGHNRASLLSKVRVVSNA